MKRETAREREREWGRKRGERERERGSKIGGREIWSERERGGERKKGVE